MKRKIFTLIAVLCAVLGVNAKTILTSTWNSWGAGCTVDGNKLTYTSAWAGAGYWVSPVDCTGNEALVIIFDGPVTGGLKFVAQFNGCSVSSDELMINEGEKIAKIDLTTANLAGSLTDLDQVFLQSTMNSASCTVSLLMPIRTWASVSSMPTMLQRK